MGKKPLDPTGKNLRCEIGVSIDILEPKKQQGFLTHYNDLDNVQTWNIFLGKCGSCVCKLFAAHGLSDVHPVHPSMALWWSFCPLVSYADIKIVFTLSVITWWSCKKCVCWAGKVNQCSMCPCGSILLGHLGKYTMQWFLYLSPLVWYMLCYFEKMQVWEYSMV